jgi:hypothetical protein
MGPPVVLGQRLSEGAGPVGHGPLADFAAGDRKLVDGDRERREDELLICLYEPASLE